MLPEFDFGSRRSAQARDACSRTPAATPARDRPPRYSDALIGEEILPGADLLVALPAPGAPEAPHRRRGSPKCTTQDRQGDGFART